MLSRKIEYVYGSKQIYVYDNVLEFQFRQNLFTYFSNSYFTTYGYDADFTVNRHRQLFSKFGPHDITQSGFLQHQNIQSLVSKHQLESLNISAARVNAVVASERNRCHADNCDWTMIYCANMNWPIEWGGHLLFPNDSADDLDHVVAFKPGRICLFEGTIPHLVQTPTPISEDIRFSFILQFSKDQNNDHIKKVA